MPHPRDEPVPFTIRPLQPADRPWVAEALGRSWGTSLVVSTGETRDAADLPGFVAESGTAPGERLGLVTYEIVRGGCEVVTLDSFAPRRGVGTALLDRVRATALRAGCRWLWLVTTNDNTHALRFYQRRGWDLVALRRDVLAEWRKLKPQIPERGVDDIPIRHALELELPIDADPNAEPGADDA